MTTTNYINSGYITKMGDSSTNDGTAGRPVDGIDFPHSGLIKTLNVMASTGYPVLNANVGSGSHNFNMDMDDTTSSGYTTITVRAGMVIREGVAVSVAQGTITEISSGSPTDVQFIEQGSAGENFYHVIVVNSSNVIKIRNPSAKDKVADLTNGDIPIAILRVQHSETPTARHLQYLGTDVQSNSISFAYDNSGVYTEMSKITAASGGTTVEVATAGGDFTIDNTDADKKIVMRLGSDDANTDFEVRNNSDAVKFSVDGAGTTDVKSLSLGTAGELTITESSDDITIKNTVADKDIIFNVNDGGSDTEVMRIDGATSVVGIGTNAPDATLHIKSTSGNNPVLKLENTSTTANDEPSLLFDRSAGSGGSGAIADSDNIGQIIFRSRNDAGTPESIDYSKILAEVNDMTDGTEDGKLIFYNMKAGTSAEYMRFASNMIINSGGADIDFIVEGDTDANLLYSNAGTDRIGIGLSNPSAKLNLKGLLDESITGTVTTTNGSETITGSGTSFLSELRAGQAIKVGSETRIIHNIASDTSLTVDATTPFTSGGGGVVSGGNAYIDDDLLIMEDGNGTDILTIRNNSLIGLDSGIVQSVRHINAPTHGTSSTLYSTDRNIIVDLAAIPMPAQDYDFSLNGDNTADIGRIFTIQCVAIGGGAPMEGTGVDIVLSGSDVLKDLDNSVIANSSTRLQIVAGKSYTILQEARNIFRVIHKNV